MFSYYDARADGYDDFYQGKGQAVPELASEYPIDTAAVSRLLEHFGHGDVIDLACGTGFWLSAYGANCRTVTLVDQSADVLARCRHRVRALGLDERARVIHGDLFEVALDQSGYDAAIVGFLLSHLTPRQTDALFKRIRTLLRPQAMLAVVDSAWSDARRPYRKRDGLERRTLPDGRSFVIRKKYFDRDDLDALLERHGFHVISGYAGNVFIAALATGAL
jgi:ubiquinone/menaquinone biosynthesis C-methylase UbiE